MGPVEHFIGIEAPVPFLIKNFFMPIKLQRLTFTFNNQIVQVIIISLSSMKMIVNTISLPILISENIISLFLIRSCTVDDVDCV